jgi:hypothetical protein
MLCLCLLLRDPRMCPGCLGFALGEAPDLTNMVLSVSTVEEGEHMHAVIPAVSLASLPGNIV